MQYFAHPIVNPRQRPSHIMPILQNPRQEAFAQSRAKGARLDDAYEIAGFAPGNSHASRLARRPEVAERIGELLAARAEAGEAGPTDSRTVIAALLRLAEAGPSVANPSAIHETRLVLLDACRLMEEVEKARGRDRDNIICSW